MEQKSNSVYLEVYIHEVKFHFLKSLSLSKQNMLVHCIIVVLMVFN